MVYSENVVDGFAGSLTIYYGSDGPTPISNDTNGRFRMMLAKTSFRQNNQRCFLRYKLDTRGDGCHDFSNNHLLSISLPDIMVYDRFIERIFPDSTKVSLRMTADNDWL